MSQICLEIDNLDALMAFLQDAKGIGLLKDVSLTQVKHNLSKKDFPIRVPVNLNAVLAVAENKIVKAAFGKTIEKKTVDILKAIEAG